MSRFDHAIKQALAIEQAEILKRYGENLHTVNTIRLFARRSRWRSAGLIAVLVAALVGGLWKSWNALRADAVVDALHWGLPFAVLVVAALIVRMAQVQMTRFNRLHLATRRLQLVVIR